MKTTLEGLKQDIQYLRAAFPDFHLTIEDSIADGENVWIRMTARGTNLGPCMGPPTGKSITITVMDVCRFANGKIVEHWGVPDRFAVLASMALLVGVTARWPTRPPPVAAPLATTPAASSLPTRRVGAARPVARARHR